MIRLRLSRWAAEPVPSVDDGTGTSPDVFGFAFGGICFPFEWYLLHACPSLPEWFSPTAVDAEVEHVLF